MSLREILERSPTASETPSDEDEFSGKLNEAKEMEEGIIERLEASILKKPTLGEYVEILTQLESCRESRKAAEKIQADKTAKAKQAVEDQEAWIAKIEESMKSIK